MTEKWELLPEFYIDSFFSKGVGFYRESIERVWIYFSYRNLLRSAEIGTLT